MFVVSTVMACSPQEHSVQEPAVHVSKLDQLAAMPAASLSPTGELAAMFNLMSEYTDLQRENKLREIKGKVVEWSLTVYEVEREGDGYSIQTGNSDELGTGNEVGTLIHVSPRSEQDNAVIAALKTGSRISIKGVVEDDWMRSLVISPAILFQPSSAKPVLVSAAQAAAPVAKQVPVEAVAQQSSEVCAEIFKQAELNAGDNNVMCSNLEFEIADKELNGTYKTVMAGLAPDQKSALKSEQIAWIKVKEKQCGEAAAGAINFRQETLSKNQCLIEMTTQRSAYLKTFNR